MSQIFYQTSSDQILNYIKAAANTAYAIPSTIIFLVVFATVWISFILQYDPVKIVFALYLLLTTAQLMDHVILIPPSNMLNMSASMLGPNIGHLVKTLYYLYRNVSHSKIIFHV